ncbi:MAG: hypothetical protein WA208_08385, partial [Thermoanaerobaculia bacterium]
PRAPGCEFGEVGGTVAPPVQPPAQADARRRRAGLRPVFLNPSIRPASAAAIRAITSKETTRIGR